MTERLKSGIYKITVTANNRFYIGSSVNIKQRWRSHLSCLRRSSHGNKYLQNCFNKYGENDIKFSVIEMCDTNELISREQYYIDTLNPELNICKVVGSVMAGREFSPEHKAKISAAIMGHKHTPQAKAKIGAAGKGRTHTPEARAKISAAGKGRKMSPEARAKIAKAATGRKMSPKSIAKMAATKRGKKLSTEHIAKISAAHKGKKRTPEQRAKMSAWQKGRPGKKHTPETKAKMSATRKGKKQSPELIAKRTASWKANRAKKQLQLSLWEIKTDKSINFTQYDRNDNQRFDDMQGQQRCAC